MMDRTRRCNIYLTDPLEGKHREYGEEAIFEEILENFLEHLKDMYLFSSSTIHVLP